MLRTLVAACCLVALVSPALAQTEPVTLEGVATALGFDAAQVARLRQEETLARNIDGATGQEVAFAVLAFFPHPVERVAGLVRSGRVLDVDSVALSHGAIGSAPSGALAYLTLPDAQVDDLGRSGPGPFNLSTDEIDRLAEAGEEAEEGAERRYALLGTFRALLAERVAAYRSKGLAGIAPYARSRGRETSAATALRKAIEADAGLARMAPTFYEEIADYPKHQRYEHSYVWRVDSVEGNPTPVLVHSVFAEKDGFVAGASRRFYVGRGFDALQVLSIFMPVEGGTAVAYTNRTSTDRLAGAAGRVGRPIARRMGRESVLQLFREIREDLAKR